MSNVSIFEKKWLDLVFEGKNQEYGAYKLRQESSKTSLLALFFGIVFLGGGTFVLSSFSSASDVIVTETPTIDEGVHAVKVHIEDNKRKTEKTITPKTSEPVVKDNKHYVVAETDAAKTDIKKTDDSKSNVIPTDNGGGGGGTPSDVKSGGGEVIVVNVPKPIDDSKHSTKELDRQPMFPGGIQNFYKYVGNNFEKQEIEDGEVVRVLVSFVIEKNGSMTDIEVIQKTNSDVDKEAIRVLKSLKTKWTPGIKDGEPVRTQYTLPITVTM